MGATPPALVAGLAGRDMTETSVVSDRVPSPDRKVFLSPDCKEEQLRAEMFGFPFHRPTSTGESGTGTYFGAMSRRTARERRTDPHKRC
jgi:hypothetical protein